MRVGLHLINTDEDNATNNQVPANQSDRKSKRKMDRGRYMGRGIFKSPPQPHMCIQDSLVGSKEPCFINVLSWEKISMPANPNDPIPLYGGIRIINNSLNALSCSNLWQAGRPGEQPVIFAVLANTEILKLNGKTAQDPNEREALIYLILDFIEVMNAGVQFQHHFKVLPDRDVVGELKDIWFIIQSKRDQERLEITYHGEGDRSITDRQNSSVKIHKKDFVDDPDKMRGREIPLSSEQEKEKLSRSHSYPNGNSNKGPSGSSWFAPRTKQGGYKDNSHSNNKTVSGVVVMKTLDHQPQKTVDVIPTYQADDEEIVLWESGKPKPVIPQKQFLTSCGLPSTSNYSHIHSDKKSVFSSGLYLQHDVSKESSQSLSESIENKVRGEIFTQMNHTKNTEVLHRKPISHRREKVSLPSFSESLQKEIIKFSLVHGNDKINGEKSVNEMKDSEPSHSLDSFASRVEEDNMFDQVRQVVASEILPSLDSIGNDYEKDLSVHAKGGTPMNPKHLNLSGIISHCPFALKTDSHSLTQGAAETHQVGGIVSTKSVALENDNKVSPVQTVFKQLTQLTDALDSLDQINVQTSIITDSKHTGVDSGAIKNNVQDYVPCKVDNHIEGSNHTDEKLVSDSTEFLASAYTVVASDKKDTNRNLEAAANINTSDVVPLAGDILPCSNSLQAIIGKATVSEGSKTLEVIVSLHDQENNKLTIG